MLSETKEVTGILKACYRGDGDAFDRLMSLVYEDLRQVARRQLNRSRPGNTLNTTSLVHEAYLKMADHSAFKCSDRVHFFSIAARAMRQIIVDYARKRCTAKRGGNQPHVNIEERQIAADGDAERYIAIDLALKRLSQLDERMTRVVECRLFAGMTVDETAIALDLSPRTVHRCWVQARARLKQELH